MEILILIVLAVVAESVWETLKMTWQEGKASIDKIGALVISIIITLGTNINIMPMLGLSIKWNLMGAVLTAILISRGSSFIHELVNKITTIKSETVNVKTKTFYE